MEQEKKSSENQGDFFDQLMFGPRRQTSEFTQEEQLTNQSVDNNNTVNNQQNSNQETSQLEHIIQIAQVVGPYLSKLSPMLSNLQSLFSNKK
ncbi:hypothetical protein [Alkalihalobacillus sp. BA299]|uniref:hypothetical protein n=1 Tax=Alkalihalobacillus sp. BA299 TaxID=2815938 RepID=UPI001ADCE248|nr:hypothetical protein [Alkalihalobacillus sp. BA299]